MNLRHLVARDAALLAVLALLGACAPGCTRGELTRSDPHPTAEPSDPNDPSERNDPADPDPRAPSDLPSDTSDPTTQSPPTDPSDSAEPGASLTPREDVRMYVFGHSLAAYSEPNTAVGEAMCLVARAAGRPCCGDGQWPTGFHPSALSNYTFPPANRQSHSPPCWNGSFATSRFNVVTITETNFYFDNNPPTTPYPADGLRLIGQIRSVYPDIPVYLYEHWPPLRRFTFDEWKRRHYRDFHDWYTALQDEMNRRDPRANVKFIPVGWLFARMLHEIPALRTLRQSDLFVDTDPHGTPTTYYIAGLIHYMAIYRERAPTDLTAPSHVHPTVRTNLAAITDFVWREIQTLRDSSGRSRVF